MALTKFTKDTNVILNVGTNPEDRTDLNDNTFKSKWDENATDWKEFWNDTASDEIDALIAAESTAREDADTTLENTISSMSQKSTNRFMADVSTITTGDTTTITTGFQPKRVTAFSSITGLNLFSLGIGYGVNKGINLMQYNASIGSAYNQFGALIWVAPDGSNSIIGKITSITSTGFVITWTITGTVTGTIIVEMLSEGV